MIFILILIILLILISLIQIKEKFVSCSKIPSGPYKTKCTNIEYKNNILYALCPKQEPENTFEYTKLDLSSCVNDLNDCDSINVNSDGSLICE
jgi:hypothetical protein